jgi:hypothetical protein
LRLIRRQRRIRTAAAVAERLLRHFHLHDVGGGTSCATIRSSVFRAQAMPEAPCFIVPPIVVAPAIRCRRIAGANAPSGVAREARSLPRRVFNPAVVYAVVDAFAPATHLASAVLSGACPA